jgi:hypothetical protein
LFTCIFLNKFKANLKIIEKADIGNNLSSTNIVNIDISKTQIFIPKDKLTELTYQERMIMRREKYGKTNVSKTVKKSNKK